MADEVRGTGKGDVIHGGHRGQGMAGYGRDNGSHGGPGPARGMAMTGRRPCRAAPIRWIAFGRLGCPPARECAEYSLWTVVTSRTVLALGAPNGGLVRVVEGDCQSTDL
jgi:hypothetical protein